MMPSMQKGNCSWSLLATVGALLVMLSVVHLFLFPLGPTLDYFGVREAQTTCVPTNKSTKGKGNIQYNVELDLDHQFPADLHNAVIYYGAPWKAEIGCWLSGCDAIVEEIHINEKISGKARANDCSGQGVCNYELGQCRCFHGFSGQVCSKALNLPCNYPASPEMPYGPWVVSICPASCDKTRAMFFCGEGIRTHK